MPEIKMKLSEYTLSLLDDIERRIDPETEEDYRNQWKSFWNGTADVPVFRPYRKKVSSPSVEIKNIAINDALSDYELMLDSQLADISGRLSSRSVALGMRANYGTGIMSSLFGAEIFIMPTSFASCFILAISIKFITSFGKLPYLSIISSITF